MQFSFLHGNEITLKNLVIWSNLRKMLICGSGARDIHHGLGFLQVEAGPGMRRAYQMRMSDMWWLISLITTHSATSYNHSLYYQEWWVQLESPMSPCLPSWYNSPDLTQTWRMSVLFSQQPHSCQSVMINRGRFSIRSDKIRPES